ncbi:unnamed protein product [Urochloa humidicola]
MGFDSTSFRRRRLQIRRRRMPRPGVGRRRTPRRRSGCRRGGPAITLAGADHVDHRICAAISDHVAAPGKVVRISIPRVLTARGSRRRRWRTRRICCSPSTTVPFFPRVHIVEHLV